MSDVASRRWAGSIIRPPVRSNELMRAEDTHEGIDKASAPITMTRSSCGRSSMAEFQPSKLAMRVRFPSPAPTFWRIGACDPTFVEDRAEMNRWKTVRERTGARGHQSSSASLRKYMDGLMRDRGLVFSMFLLLGSLSRSTAD